MKRRMKFLFVLLAFVVMASSVVMSVSANERSGIIIVPIKDPDYWENQIGDNMYDVVTNPDGWTKWSLNSKGELTISKTSKSEVGWPRVRTLLEEKMPILDLKKYPNLYYDFTVGEGAHCMIQLDFAGIPVKFGKAIAIKHKASYDEGSGDIGPGTYKGYVDINQVIKDEGILGFAGKTMMPHANIYVIDTGSTGAKVTVRALSIGNSNASEKDGPYLDSKLNAGKETTTTAKQSTAANNNQKTSTTANAGGTTASVPAGETTTTVAGSTTATDNPLAPGLAANQTSATSSTKPVASQNTMQPWVIILLVILAVLLAAAAVVIVLLMKKNKPETVAQAAADDTNKSDPS